MGDWRWKRLASIVLGAVAGLVGGWLLLGPNVSRYATAFAGLFLLVGMGCVAALLLLAWVIITDDIRPRFVARRPQLPLTLTTELGAMIGTRRFMTHPISFWTGLTLNHRLFIGVLVMSKPEEMTLDRQDMDQAA